MQINPLTAIDFYKADHRRQYPEGTTLVYSNLTARSDKLSNVPAHVFEGETVFFGLQYFCKHFLQDVFNNNFFNLPKEKVLADYARRMDNALGKGAIPVDHIAALHDLGYLPICIRALPEGSVVPVKVPMLVIYNTLPEFFWLTNYLETVMSCYLWKPIVSATTAYYYRKVLQKFADITGGSPDFINFQAHDFSFRGMSNIEDAALSGAAHLTSFYGTDTVAAIDLVEQYYGADSDKELVGCSVPATEHSVMCMGTMESEIATFRRLINDLYPRGIVSIVSDTWDFWKVITSFASTLKTDIMARDGKVVFRPDSGDPVDIICGDATAEVGTPEHKGAVQCLWDIFGGTVNAKGFKTLDPHVGLIYGDSITIDRAHRILEGLAEAGFASDNVVFGVGSYTYQYVTRDTFGMAVKSTYGVVKGDRRAIFKDPATDIGKMKKSARGLIRVVSKDGKLSFIDNLESDTPHDTACLMMPVFVDGEIVQKETLEGIRANLRLHGRLTAKKAA